VIYLIKLIVNLVIISGRRLSWKRFRWDVPQGECRQLVQRSCAS